MNDNDNAPPDGMVLDNIPDTFDPAKWLSDLQAAGGWWVIGADHTLALGWREFGCSDDQQDRARAAVRELNDDRPKREVIREYLIASNGEVHHGQA